MNTIDAIQGSQEWLDIRAKHFTASEAPAMMNASKYTTRAALLKHKATGIAEDIDAGKQRLFDRGHAAEAAARPVIEAILGEELYPATGTLEVDGLPLLASFDGLSMMEDVAWENKLFNAALADAIRAGQPEPHYYWQLEQQLLVSGADKVYFTTSDGTKENTVGLWYDSLPERRAALIAGWKQFAEDLAAYEHVPETVNPVSAEIELLPALMVQVEGKVLSTNLDAFKSKALAFIGNIKTELVSDQDFADADKMTKFLKDGEERLALAKSQALAQTASIDELFRAIDAISGEMKAKRLALEKLVKAEKENRKADIVLKAQHALMEHRAKLVGRIGGNWLPQLSPAIFTEAIKGLKSLDSMNDKVAGALAQAKIEANEIADTIEANRKSLEISGTDNGCMHLFPDFAQVCTKAKDDFAALLSMRLQQDTKRREDERAEEAKRVADEAAKLTENNQTQFEDQRGKADAGMGLEQSGRAQPEAASTPPIQADEANDEAVIDDFIRLLSIGAVEKKALRVNILKWEKYRIARAMSAAA